MILGFNRDSAKIVFPLVLAAFLCGVMGNTFAWAAPKKGKAVHKERVENLNRFFQLAGVDQTAYKIDAQLFDHRFNQSELPVEQITMLKNILQRVYQPEEWLEAIRHRMLRDYSPQYMNALQKWYRSPLGKKIVQAELDDLTQGMTQKKAGFIDDLQIYPPRENRLQMVEKLEQTVGMTDYTMDTLMMLFRTLYPFNDQFKGKSPRTVSREIRDDLYDPLREQILQSFLYKFRHLSDPEFSQYIKFATSNAGKWFFRSYLRGSRDSLEKTTVKLERLLTRVAQEMDSGRGESNLLKEIAPPGQRYVFARMRDPFIPLVDPNLGIVQAVEKDETQMEFRQFSDELKSLPPIPLEVYKNLKRANPKLYSQLEYYGGLFKQEAKVAAMDEGDFLETVNKYKDLLQKANDAKPDMILTPLQTAYESLRLVGVIWKNKVITALIETGDNKGHSVNEGDMLGPNFGVVEAIHQNEISILEQSRDYLGNILSKKKEIDFIQESPEEG